MKTTNGRQNLALFAIAIVNLAIVADCLSAHVPITYVVHFIAALVVTLFLAFVSFDLKETRYMADLRGALAVPLPKEFEEVAKRIRRFGPDGEHPQLTRAEWMRAIAAEETQDSYWGWVTKSEIFVSRIMKTVMPGPQNTINLPIKMPSTNSGVESIN